MLPPLRQSDQSTFFPDAADPHSDSHCSHVSARSAPEVAARLPAAARTRSRPPSQIQASASASVGSASINPALPARTACPRRVTDCTQTQLWQQLGMARRACAATASRRGQETRRGQDLRPYDSDLYVVPKGRAFGLLDCGHERVGVAAVRRAALDDPPVGLANNSVFA